MIFPCEPYSGGPMKRVLSAVVFLLVFLCVPWMSFADVREQPVIRGGIESSAALRYRAPEDSYEIDYPLYATVGFFYKTETLESFISIDYIDELALGETYLLGGTEYSHIKIGYYNELWGTGYALSPLDAVNPRDERYPQNVFYRTRYAPVPNFRMTFGNEVRYTQIVLSHTSPGEVQTVEDTELRVRAAWQGEGSIAGLGFVRRLGAPPPLFFITAKSDNESSTVWMELDWEYRAEAKDLWSFVLGTRRRFQSSEVYAEYVLDRSKTSLFFFEELLQVHPIAQFNLRTFVHIPDFSSAFNGCIRLTVNPYLEFSPGFYFFFGKAGKHFSPLQEDNNNVVYLKLTYTMK
jgi:hypothetical protein